MFQYMCNMDVSLKDFLLGAITAKAQQPFTAQHQLLGIHLTVTSA
jgi:hypothetical protein